MSTVFGVIAINVTIKMCSISINSVIIILAGGFLSPPCFSSFFCQHCFVVFESKM